MRPPPEPHWGFRDNHPHLMDLTVLMMLVVVIVTSILLFVMYISDVRADSNQTPEPPLTIPLSFPTTTTSTTSTVPTG